MTTTLTHPAPTHSKRAVALTALVAAAITSVVNVGLASAAVALGTTATLQLEPRAYLTFTVLGAVLGAIGWAVIARRARNPRRLLMLLAVGALLASFVALAVLAASTVGATGWSPIIALAIMHVATIGLAYATYSRALPVRRLASTS